MTKTTLFIALAFPALLAAGVGGHFAGREASKASPRETTLGEYVPPSGPKKPTYAPVAPQGPEQVGPRIKTLQCPDGLPQSLFVTHQNINCTCAIPPNYRMDWTGGCWMYGGVSFGGIGWGGAVSNLAWGAHPYLGFGWDGAALKQCSPFRMEWVVNMPPNSGCTGSYRLIISE